jgi:hypothetical protein
MISKFLVLLLILSFLMISWDNNATGVNTDFKNISYNNLDQFEWPQIQGDPSFTRFSTGASSRSI